MHTQRSSARDFLRYIGPGLLVTVGFIDPGNWASNISAGADYGYTLLWMVTLSTIMLIILQHNVAHLGIVTGDCLAEAATRHLPAWLSRGVLSTAVFASISTALAEVLGGAIALNLLTGLPIKLGAILTLGLVLSLLFTNSYRKLEKLIIGFVSLIGISFVYEISIVNVDWGQAVHSWATVSFPPGAMPIIMAVLGAVVMPHNLFLHSEIIQSRQWNKENDQIIKMQLKYEFADTLFSMIIGWAINSSMIILAATTFFTNNIKVDELGQAQKLLEPMIGNGAGIVFGLALLFSGIASTTTAGMAGGSVVAGFFKKPYDIKDKHSRYGVTAILIVATLIIFMLQDTFKGLIYSQMILSIQLPITVFLQVYLTSSEKVMGKYKNKWHENLVLWMIALILTVLNVMLFKSFFE
jgi:manganese transport protein